jgi:hypothetical protein
MHSGPDLRFSSALRSSRWKHADSIHTLLQRVKQQRVDACERGREQHTAPESSIGRSDGCGMLGSGLSDFSRVALVWELQHGVSKPLDASDWVKPIGPHPMGWIGS